MKINNIKLENYRNISSMYIEFDDINIIWGENAQGKTNLIEAIYLFTGAKSFRGVRDKELIQFEKDSAKLNIKFFSNNREQNAQIEIKDKRKATLNGINKKSCNDFSDEIKAIVFSPIHLSMIKDGPSERRNFVDSALCQLKSNYRNVLKEYNKALKQRNHIIKNIEKYGNNVDSFLDIWDAGLVKYGAKIIYQRMMYINALKPYVKEIFNGISNGKENIDLVYSSFCDYQCDINFIENALEKKLSEHRQIDIKAGTTLCGPHRDDIKILINDVDVRSFGSQGQQRSCVLALKLAEARLLKEMTNIEPIALLDDVMSELDEKRQDYILNHIKNLQVFITCCDKETILRLKKGKTFHIENGKLLESWYVFTPWRKYTC